ncbi:MAG: response regulator [Phycisphaerae bacterium]|nr:response regulator [Phycisphaerae bacterium]
MVWAPNAEQKPLELVVTGEAESWLPALRQIVGPQLLHARRVRSDHELLEVVRAGQADAAVLDDESPWDLEVLPMLRMIRRLDQLLPVVIVTAHTDRQWMENALQLAAYSVVVKPLELEPLLRQIHGIMLRLSQMLREK